MAAGRHDPDAVEWIRRAAELPAAAAELRAWLAVCEVRAGRADLDRHRPVVLDADVPAAWRAELGLSLSRIVEQAGGRDTELFEHTWAALEGGTRPDWLALSLSGIYAAAGRTDAGTTSVYEHAFQADPSAEHARLLGHAYLADDSVPVRQKIAHWRACLDRGRADPEMLTELAKAYAAEGAATEAALNVVENMPVAQQPRVLDELCRYRFRRGDYRSAETIAAALVQLRPDDPDALWKLLLCRVRNALAADQRLDRVDLSAAAAWPGHAGLCGLTVLVAAATGQPVADAALADALHTGVAPTPALLAARAVLAGQPGGLPAEAETPEEELLLAAAEHVRHGAEAARRRLRDARDPDLRLFERALAAQQAAEAGRLEQAWQCLTPAAHRQGPPWDSYRPVLVHLALRAAPVAGLDSLNTLFDARQGFAAALRRVSSLAEEHDPAALDRLYDMDAAADLPTWRAMHVALVCRTVQDELIAGAVERADLRLAVLREVEPVPEAVTWLSAVTADRRGDLDAALAHAYHLPAELRARPGVAWTLASWFLRNHQVRMAEAALRHALAAHEDRALRFAVTALNGQLGRGDEFVHTAAVLLETIPVGWSASPRRR
ncbi:MAG: hypothetical protein HYU66_16810 [Armatimonadetes bacterium]|nr:hypothetical protein [Armatimonadota bacterium]